MGCTKSIQQQSSRKNQQVIIKNPLVQKQQTLKYKWTCPNCIAFFPIGSPVVKFEEHIKTCITMAEDQSSEHNDLGASQLKKSKLANIEYAYQKKNQSGIESKWQKVEKKSELKVSTKGLTAKSVRQQKFETKSIWFREELEKKKISWENGCEKIAIDRKNLLQSCLARFRSVNLFKQVKVQFLEQKAYDAGGLLRQLIHLVTKQLFKPEQQLFIRADTDELTYKLHRSEFTYSSNCKQLLTFYGRILGKALLERIPIGCYMDRSIVRQLCGRELELTDMHSYDKSTYLSLKSILDNKIVAKQTEGAGNEGQTYCQYNFTLMQQNLQTKLFYDHQLTLNGTTKIVTEENKTQFIRKYMTYMCYQRIKPMLQALKSGLYSIIPASILSIFEPHQLEMLLYGVQFIDVGDWEHSTEYMGAYYPEHKNIRWFWQFVGQQAQEKLAKLLHFCTGTTRVPISGFSRLETNRGECSKFVIQSVEYMQKNPFPKGHTCFNRLELPVYPTRKLLEKYVTFIMEAQLEGVLGLD